MAFIKRTLLILLLIAFALLALLTVLLLTFDANRLKPLIERTAAEQGLQLTLAGDLSWRLWPSVGVRLGQVTAVPSATRDGPPLAEIGAAEVAVALRPLLSRQIQVQGLSLRDTTINLLVDASGVANWTLVGPQSAPEEAAPQDEASATPELSVDKLSIANLNLNYRDLSTGTDLSVAGLALDAEQVNLDGRAFPLTLALTVAGADLPEVAIDYRGPVQFDLDASTLSLSDGALDLASGAARGRIKLAAAVNWAAELAADGVLELEPLAVKPWLQAFELPPPAVAGGDSVALRLPFSVAGDRYTLKDARIHFDDVELTGGADITNGEPLRVVSHWRGSYLNLDRYLPAADESEPTPAPEPAAEATPLPLELLRQLALDISLQLKSLTATGLTFTEPHVAVNGEQGRIALTRLNTGLAGGTITGEGVLDARGQEATVNLQLNTQNLDLQTLLTQLADFESLSGSADAKLSITSRGATDLALMDNLQVKASAQSREAKLIPINLEQRFCEAVAILQGQAPPAYDWQKATELKPMTVEFLLAGKALDLTQLRASLAHITAQAAGSFDLESGNFNVPFQLSLGDFAGTIPGCLPISESWRKRALPIRCKGSLDAIGPTTCLPDREALTALIKNTVKTKVDAKVEQKRDEVEKRAADKAREALKKKLGDEKAGETEKNLRGVLDRLRQ